MLSLLSVVALLAAAAIHLVPAVGVLGKGALRRLYGIEEPDADGLLLLRHRAVLFGLLGLGLIGAVFVPAWRAPAFAGALISVTSFLLLAPTWPKNGSIRRVVIADWAVLVALVIGGTAEAAVWWG